VKGTACVVLALLQVITYIPSKSAKYIGGTVPTIPLQVLGKLNTSDQKALSFEWAKAGKKEAGNWGIAYSQVTALSYGQHAGRRVGAAVATTVLVSPIAGPFLVFSKKRRHYLTIEFLDEKGKSQGAVFLVGKGAIGTLLDDLEAKTGKKVQCEDEEARKAREKQGPRTVTQSR
jgi:hypothetical protein